MSNTRYIKTFSAAAFLVSAAALHSATVSLAELDLNHLHVAAWSAPRVNTSFSGKPLSLGGHTFARGIGTRATSTLWLELDGNVANFSAAVGVDDAAGSAGAVRIQFIGDGRRLWDSGTMKRGEPARPVSIELTGVRSLLLSVESRGRHA